MNLLYRINNLITNVLTQVKFGYFKLLLGIKFNPGINFRIKNTSRINIWDKNGKISVGDFFSMGYNSELYTWNEELYIGNSTSINDNCKIYGDVNIGSNCLFASNIFISSGQHNFSHSPSLPIRSQDKLNSVTKGIVIEDDCWLGFGVVVMPGTYIGKGAIVGANSVVTKDIFPYTVNAGVPCREISKRLDFTHSYTEIESTNAKHWPFFYSGFNYAQFDDLTTLEKGIQIVEDKAVFVLSKIPGNQIKISGWCNDIAKFKVFVNKDHYMETEIASGPFNLKLDLVKNLHSYPSKLNKIPNSLQEKFNIIVIEMSLKNNNPGKKGQGCAISSIGII